MGLGLALKYENESSCYPLHLATEYQGELSLPRAARESTTH